MMMKIFNTALPLLLALIAGASSHESPKSCNDQQQFNATALMATVDTDLIKATWHGIDIAPGKVNWTVTIDYMDDTVCPDSTVFMWHIHTLQLKNPGGCNNGYSGKNSDGSVPQCMATMGHVDNSFACAGPSEWHATTCTALEYSEPYSARCGTGNMQSGCEYGDLSGKMGMVDNTSREPQKFQDNFIQTPLADYYYAKSIDFHCGTTRVACANLEVVPAAHPYS